MRFCSSYSQSLWCQFIRKIPGNMFLFYWFFYLKHFYLFSLGLGVEISKIMEFLQLIKEKTRFQMDWNQFWNYHFKWLRIQRHVKGLFVLIYALVLSKDTFKILEYYTQAKIRLSTVKEGADKLKERKLMNMHVWNEYIVSLKAWVWEEALLLFYQQALSR